MGRGGLFSGFARHPGDIRGRNSLVIQRVETRHSQIHSSCLLIFFFWITISVMHELYFYNIDNKC